MLDVEYIIRNMMKRFGIEDLISLMKRRKRRYLNHPISFALVLKTLRVSVKKMLKSSNFSLC